MSSVKKIVIVGGVAGGASAAARARRLDENAEILLIERGPAISFANCGLPYHIGGVIAERKKLLVQTAESMRRRFRIDVRVNTEAVAVDRGRKIVRIRDLAGQAEQDVAYDILILSPGAEPVRPALPGIGLPGVFTLRTLQDMDNIQAFMAIRKPLRALVVGGGFIGLEISEAFRDRGLEVVLVEAAPQVLTPLDPEMAHPLHRELERNGVMLKLGAKVQGFAQAGDGLAAELSTGETVNADLAILAIGVKPEVALAAAAGLEIGGRGGIRVDEHLRTSDPAIYAVGDAVETVDLVSGRPVPVPLAGPANRQGRLAADHALGVQTAAYRGTQATAICKVFGMTAGSTGANEKTLKAIGRGFEKIYIHPDHHAGYYPGAQPLSLKLLFDPENGAILGAQVVGREGVDKRLDVLATALRGRMTVYDLEHLELAYAPPYGSAKDPVNVAGFVAANALRGAVAYCHTQDMLSPRPDQLILDVRTAPEAAAGTIPGSLNIPVDSLRDRLDEIPRDKELLIFCAVGLRSYLAARMLGQRGWRTKVLTGGYTTYLAVAEALEKTAAA